MSYRILTSRLHHLGTVGEIVALPEGVNIDALVASGAVEFLSESTLEDPKPAKTKTRKASKE